MDKAAITNLQQQSVPNITEQLPTLDRVSLIELAAQEAASTAPRTTLQTAIDKQLAALDAAEEGGNAGGDDAAGAAPTAAEKAAAEEAEATAKAAEAPKPPAKITKDDFRHPDYAGPLNGEQANWRVANIKPVEKVRTK
ncbi:hypothetical protein EAH75_04265 [Rhodanobacter glycinis]|uniref:hypothetical protein n=1 Tax=Rhodanobacter glycinis TaxID=582702 RepID=UPI00112D7B2C|nr:hypothetical protein [Rhodanobacter glycinis]TPG50659.1 hypothetical protein EAH75_04265 [Rhodanobacter glycinis]